MIRTKEEKQKRLTYLQGRLAHLQSRSHKENDNVIGKVSKQIKRLEGELSC